MLWLYYLLPCKPFFKISIHSMQVQAGIKCNIPVYKGFEDWKLSGWKLDIDQKDIANFPLASILDLVEGQDTDLDQSSYLSEISPEQFNTMSQQVDKTATSTASAIQVSCEDHTPPSAPHGYVLFVGQKLKDSAWLPGNQTPNYHMIGTSKFVRVEDLIDAPMPSADLYKSPSEDDTPLGITVHQAMVRQYVYTGNAEEDLRALQMYLDRFNRAITALEETTSSDREKGTERSFFRQQIGIARASLLEELDVFRKEINVPNEPEYYGFDSYDLGLPPLTRLTRVRSRGYKWVCK